MFSKTVIAAVAATLFTTTNAHFFISNPPPIPGSNSKSPLDAGGSNFPCQGADLTQGPVTNMAVGSQQPLKFDLGAGANTAVHGGGSCQVALTYETDKAKQKDPANWKVIHSWVGGCPTNAPGNLDLAKACSGGAGTDCVVQDFTFTIPPEAKNGNAILSWTWFNNIGNREMYMNCARVSITGGSGNLEGLPALFTANIGIGGCGTTESTNLDFPNPGKYVTKDAKLNYPLAPPKNCAAGTGSANIPSTPSGGSGSGSSTGSGSGSGSSTGSGSGSSSSGTATGSAPSSAASSTKGGKGGKGGNQGGAFAEGSSSAPSAAPSSGASTGSTPKPATAPAAAPASGSSSGSCTNGAVACSASGFYCIDASHFGECAFGCAVPMAMAAGTQCTNNAVAHAVVQKRRSNLFQRL